MHVVVAELDKAEDAKPQPWEPLQATPQSDMHPLFLSNNTRECVLIRINSLVRVCVVPARLSSLL